MESKIFLIIAVFCLAEVKPKKTPPEVPLGNADILEIDGKINGFGESVFLTGIKSLWKKPNFSKCFKKPRKDDYKSAIDNFAYQTLQAGATLNTNLPEYYKIRVKEVQIQINDLGNLLQDYQTKFSEEDKTNFQALNKLMEDYKTKFNENFKKFYLKLYAIKKTTNVNSELEAAETCDHTIQKEIKELNKQCEEIFQKIKDCTEKN